MMGAINISFGGKLQEVIPISLMQIENPSDLSSTSPQGDHVQKPSLEEVLAYAKAMVRKAIAEEAGHLPKEQLEEIEQDAYERMIKRYPEILPEGWKSLTWYNCLGATQDYMKHGKGFKEDRWSIQKAEEVGAVHAGKLQTRVSIVNSDDEDMSVDQIAGHYGVFDKLDLNKIRINWELVARLASQDECLHAFAKSLRGITLEEMAPVFGVKVARAGQLVQAFVDRFDDPEHADCPWFKQCCYALGVSELLGMGLVDQSGTRIGGLEFISIGWNLAPVDLDSTEPCQGVKETKSQMSFMDGES